MERTRLITTLLIISGIICSNGITVAQEGKKEMTKVTNKVIAISTHEGLQPSTITSQPGTTVIWVNQSRQPVEILFLDKRVVIACGSPVNFFIGKDGAYESAKIPFGGTASLCFMEKGKYEYVFKSSSTFYPQESVEYKGIIWIK